MFFDLTNRDSAFDPFLIHFCCLASLRKDGNSVTSSCSSFLSTSGRLVLKCQTRKLPIFLYVKTFTSVYRGVYISSSHVKMLQWRENLNTFLWTDYLAFWRKYEMTEMLRVSASALINFCHDHTNMKYMYVRLSLILLWYIKSQVR